MGVYTTESNWLSRRGIFLLLLILFHVVLIWGLKSGFAWKVVASHHAAHRGGHHQRAEGREGAAAAAATEARIAAGRSAAARGRHPDHSRCSAFDSHPERDRSSRTAGTAAAARSRGTSLKLNAKSSQPNVDEYYPPTSTRLGEEGTAKVKVCVGVNGRVTTATLADSSGFERLDEAAVKVAKLYRFNPATEDGKPVEACAPLPIKFKLK